jgi:hypothetical protein
MAYCTGAGGTSLDSAPPLTIDPRQFMTPEKMQAEAMAIAERYRAMSATPPPQPDKNGKIPPRKGTRTVLRLSYLGRSVILLSLALSTYNVLTARDTSTAVRRELATTTAAIGGSIVAGALAGLACGPGAPVCVTIGAFVGGALAAFGAGFIW